MSDNNNSENGSVGRRSFLAVAGGTSTAALAGCSDILDVFDDEEEEDPNWETWDHPDNVQKAQDAWEDIEANAGPTEGEAQARAQAHVEIEEARRDDMILLPFYHGFDERFSLPEVDIEPFGGLGTHRQQYNEVEIENDDTLNLINSTVSTLDPIQSTDTASGVVINQVYENLTHYRNGELGGLEGQLAEDWVISEDGRTITFDLKQNVEYHEGEELTAEDFVFAFRRLAESENSERASFILNSENLAIEHEVDEEDGVGPRNVVPESIGVEAVDDHTLELELAEATPAALEILAYDAFGAIPEGYVGDIEGYDGEVDQGDFSSEVMNGTGPFQLVEWTTGEEVELERFDDYHGSVANVETVEWQILEDDSAIETVINEGNADVFGIPTPFYDPDLVDAEEDELGRQVGTYDHEELGEIDYTGVATLSVYYIGFNARHVPLPVREAFAYVTDHEQFIDDIFKGRGEDAFSFIPPQMWREELEDVTPYDEFADNFPYAKNDSDRDAAAEVLEEAGYTDDDPFEVTFTTYEDEAFQEFGREVRDRLEGIGVEVELDETEFSILIGDGQDGELEAYTLGWIWSWNDPIYGHFGFEPANTDTSLMPGEADGYYLDWEKAEIGVVEDEE